MADAPTFRSGPAPCVAIVGATGIVGETLLRVLEERAFPVRELRALGSSRSVGTRVRFRGHELPVVAADPEALAGCQLVFFAATGELSRSLAPSAVEAGAVVIDKSSTFRQSDEVPLVVPEINARALETHRGLIACPNCTTIGLVMALEPLRRAAGLASVVVTTLQAASGAGREALAELHGMPQGVFPRPLALNVVPQCDALDAGGVSAEEHKLVVETRKILGLPELRVSATCVRVPVAVGHSASVLVETERELEPAAALAALGDFPGLRVARDTGYATPLEVAGRDEVFVGRVRRDPAHARRLWLWSVIDNLRKGAATNAVQIAEELAARGRLPG